MIPRRSYTVRHGLLLVCLCWAMPSARAGDWPVSRGPSHEPVPCRFDPKMVARVPRPFLDDSAACILYYGTTHLIEADGTVETIIHEITRLNGRKGIESLGEYRNITFDPSYQKLVLNEARIIKADGRIVPIEPRHAQLRDISTDYQVYDRDKQLVISFPNLEVGDVYEVKWTTRGRNAEMASQFFTRITFGDDLNPVVRDEMRIRLPKNKPLKYATINGKLEPAISTQGDHRLYHWQVNHRPGLPQDSDRPSREVLRLQVACSTFASWEEVGRWKHRLRADCWQCTPEIRGIVRDVTGRTDWQSVPLLKTPLEKARALTYWVRRHVRYISISSAGHGYTPRLPAQVLASRYGDCKDQAQLLAVMLREAGLDVSLVTLGTLDEGQVVPEVPSPWGTHAILLVRIAGRDHWIDTTVNQAAWDFLPRSDRDRVVYVTQNEKIRILRTPPLTWADNRVEQTTEMQIRADGTSSSRRGTTYHGLSALGRREAWRETPPGERRRLVTADLQDAHSRSRLLALHIDDGSLADLDRPVTARMEYEIGRHFAGDPTREGSITDSSVWNRILAFNLDPERRLALNLGVPFESIHQYKIQLPLAYRFDGLPADREVRSRWGFFRLTVKADARDPRQLAVIFHTRLEKVLVEPADFAAFESFYESLFKHWRVWLSLKPTHDLADAPALELLQILAPERARANVLAQLYLHNGRNKDAHRVARHALHFHPGDRALWDLAVQSAASLDEQESAYRELVRRFPNNPEDAIALGAILVKRGDHIGAKKVLLPLTGHISAEVRGSAHYQLAQSAFAAKQAGAALKHLEAAGRANPEGLQNGDALRFKARVHEQQNQVLQAIVTYREALQIGAEAEDVLAALIRLELAVGHNNRALDHLRRYTVLAGKNLDRLVKAANFHFQMGRLEDAFELAQRARDIRFHAGAQRLLGLIHLRRNELDRAVFHLERADLDAEVLTGLIHGQLLLGKLRQARRNLEVIGNQVEATLELRRAEVATLTLLVRKARLGKEIQVEPASADALDRSLDAFVCAEFALEEGRPVSQVQALLAAAFDQGVEVGPAFALRGLLALQQGRLSKALADADKAIALGPPEARAFLVRGRVRLERAELGTLADLEKAAALSMRKDGIILHWLAAAQFQAGRRVDALVSQRLAVRLRPRDAELLEQLRDFERADSEATNRVWP